MEHREPPRIIAGDHRLEGALEDAGGRFPFRRFPFVRNHRQIHHGRALLFIVAALAVLIALVYLGSQARRAAFDWLHRQPQYQVPFDEIRLVPEPPPWFRGGKPVFLDGVRREARESESIAILEVPTAQVHGDFKNYPWVREVQQVVYGHGTIVVHLRYRQPVAYVQLSSADRRLLDETGTILSLKDINLVQLGHPFKITGTGLATPSDSRVGVVWKSRREGSDQDEPDPRILAAAKLAGYLSQPAQLADAEHCPALRMMDINVTEFRPFGLFLRNDEGVAIWWRDAPGDESAGRPTADQKWAMLRRWGEAADRQPLPKEDYLAFDNTGIYPHCRHDPPHGIKKKGDR